VGRCILPPMLRSGVRLPEPFATALCEGRAADVCGVDCGTPEEFFARALARIDVGDEVGARRDLDAAEPALRGPCRVEKAFLDIRQRSALMTALCSAREVLADSDATDGLRARALHAVGLAEGKLRRTVRALDALLEARRLYAAEGDQRGRSQVHDTLGMLHAARGRLDHAVYWYALSLADKALLGDRLGMAITLGNLGRLHLRAGRFDDALDCLERDLELAQEMQDLRGQARMHEDIGRAHAGREDGEAAESAFRQAILLAEQHGFRDIAFFAWRDLCELLVRRGDVAGAEHAFHVAKGTVPRGGEGYLDLLLATAEAELMLARGSADAVPVLSRTVADLAAAELPDLEIPARLLLARALRDRGNDTQAERCLMVALARARKDGYARYLAPLNEALTELGMVEGGLDEETRGTASGTGGEPGAYILREKLGAGGFGEVYRAYDPERSREVAFKRIFLHRIYDPEQRAFLATSARLELEAAARVRHPGVVRVFALGTEDGGGMYVVQELVEGRSLRQVMDRDTDPESATVMSVLAEIAHALDALHEAGVVHRDLKPENVIVRGDGTPVLIDFGIAHVAASKAGQDAELVAGTLEYMAPEQMQGRKVDGRADLYALGVIAFEWLTGVRPLHPAGDGFSERVKHMSTTPAPRLTEYRPELPDDLDRFLATLLAKKPRRRPQGAAEVAEMFETFS